MKQFPEQAKITTKFPCRRFFDRLDDEGTAIKLKGGLQQLLQTGGFHLKKWNSN